MRYYTKGTDIVGYTFQADIYCPACVIEEMIDAGLAAPAARDMGAENALDQCGDAAGIDRYDEYSFDSGDFPKVVFAVQIDDETCGRCGNSL